jgi:hypothetical protein
VKEGEQAPPVPGIIDTLSAGFQIVNRAPWVLAVPIALDLLLWLGPRLSIATLAGRAVAGMSTMVTQAGAAAGAAAEGQVEGFRQGLEALQTLASTFNMLSLLAFGGFALESAVPPEQGGAAGQVELLSGGLVLLLAIVLLVLGIGLAALWLGGIAQLVRDGQLSAARLFVKLPRYWLSIIGFLALLIGGAIAITLPLLLLAAVAQLFVPALGTFLTLFVAVALQLLVIWSLLYLFFFADAVVVSEVGPIRAAANSIKVVSLNFWATLGFIIITWVIMRGLHIIWQSLAQAPVGLALAIFGNGYVESGLAAASMLFYRNRIARTGGG